ncbi:MAG: hypothetical protein R6U88_02685 [Candidatus Bipolaricaulota bacterium]
MAQVKERILRLIDQLPEEWLPELAEHLEDSLALAQAKREDDGSRVPWRKVRRTGSEDNTG